MCKQKYGYVYMTHDIINDKYYIGQHLGDTFNPHYRGSGIKLKEAIKQFGASNFIPILLNWCYSKEDLDNMEKFWIKTLNASSSDKFYNISLGGSGGQSFYYGKFSDLHRKHLSEALKGRVPWLKGLNMSDPRVFKCSQSFRGHKHTKEAKSIMSYKHRKENLSDDTILKHRQSCIERSVKRGRCYWVNDGDKEYLVNDLEFQQRFATNEDIILGRLSDLIYVNKDNKSYKIHKNQLDEYLNNGYMRGRDTILCNKLSKIRQHFYWCYDNLKFNTSKELTNYLNSHGYPKIAMSTVQNIVNGKIVKTYLELTEHLYKTQRGID